MAWTTPSTVTPTYLTGTLETGKPVSAAAYATYVKANLQDVYTALGPVTATYVFADPLPLSIGTLTTSGSLASVSRADHVHGVPPSWGIDVRVRNSAQIAFRPVLNFVSGATATDTGSAINVTFQQGGFEIPVFAAPGNSVVGHAGSAGTAVTQSRADHRHGRTGDLLASTAPGALVAGTASTATTAVSLARSDHVHQVPASIGARVILGSDTATALADRPRIKLAGSTNVTITGAASTTGTSRMIYSVSGASSVLQTIGVSANTGLSSSGIIGPRSIVNFVSGPYALITVADNATLAKTDVTIAAQVQWGSTSATIGAAGNSPGGFGTGNPGAPGTSALLSRANHGHAFDGTSSLLTASPASALQWTSAAVTTASLGTNQRLSRSSHVHASPVDWPVDVTVAGVAPTNQANLAARSAVTLVAGVNAVITTTDDGTSTQIKVDTTGAGSYASGLDVLATQTVTTPAGGVALVSFTGLGGYASTYQSLIVRWSFRSTEQNNYSDLRFYLNSYEGTTYGNPTWYPCSVNLLTNSQGSSIYHTNSAGNVLLDGEGWSSWLLAGGQSDPAAWGYAGILAPSSPGAGYQSVGEIEVVPDGVSGATFLARSTRILPDTRLTWSQGSRSLTGGVVTAIGFGIAYQVTGTASTIPVGAVATLYGRRRT